MSTNRKGRRKNRKIKFSEDHYIEKYYIKKSKAYIPVKLEKISDLYMKHDFAQRELSDEVCKYIEEIAYMVPINTDIVIEIHCPDIDEENQTRIKKTIKNNYGMEIDDVDYDVGMINKKSVVLMLIGIIVLIVQFLLSKYVKGIFEELLSLFWWVVIWDMVEFQLFDNQENKWKRLNYQQLYDASIEFVFDDGKKLTETKKMIDFNGKKC